jgi:hypothetical protein
MHHAEHPTAALGRARVERDPVHGGDNVIIDRAERHDQCRDAIPASGILVAPRTTRMKTQHATGETIGKVELPRVAQVFLGRRPAWVPCFIPDVARGRNADYLVLKKSSSVWSSSAVLWFTRLPLFAC